LKQATTIDKSAPVLEKTGGGGGGELFVVVLVEICVGFV
jgi:hypothetical protein